MVAFGSDKLLIGAPYANEDSENWVYYGAAYLYSTNGTRLMTFYNPTPETVSMLGASVAAFGSDRVLIGAYGAAYLFHTNGTRLITFTNPPSAASYYNGHAVAAVGTDRVLVGEIGYGTNSGAVHLFNANGTLLLTITNPTPAVDEYFGAQMAMIGNDRVVIGARGDDSTGTYSGLAYLFNLNGALLATINNPAPGVGAGFGARLAAFGNDGVLIAAPFHNGVGAAYLYSTNGAHLMTFSNPNPDSVLEFGSSVLAFSNDRVLIGADRWGSGFGRVFLFNTNGTLLTTITNPAPGIQNNFGYSIAAVGADRILVSDPGYGTNTGVVRLFNTNGILLLTITNPTPAVDDYFSAQIATLGDDRVVIGAPGDDTTGTNAGSAYVFDIHGTLLATINNPAPGVGDIFGARLAAFGNDGVLIGAPFHNGVGAAYLFSVPAPAIPPSLTIQRTMTNTVIVSWPSPSTGFVLQQNTNGVSSVSWSNVTGSIQNDGTNKTLVVNPTDQGQFYRLFKP